MAANGVLASQGIQLEKDDMSTKHRSHVHCPVVMPRNPKLIRGEPVQEKVIPNSYEKRKAIKRCR